MNTNQISYTLFFLAFLFIALKQAEAHFYGMVEKPTKFDSKQDFIDYMLKMNQHNAITSKLGTTRYGKRSFDVSNDESYVIDNDTSEEQNVEANEIFKKRVIIGKIVKLLKLLE